VRGRHARCGESAATSDGETRVRRGRRAPRPRTGPHGSGSRHFFRQREGVPGWGSRGDRGARGGSPAGCRSRRTRVAPDDALTPARGAGFSPAALPRSSTPSGREKNARTRPRAWRRGRSIRRTPLSLKQGPLAPNLPGTKRTRRTTGGFGSAAGRGHSDRNQTRFARCCPPRGPHCYASEGRKGHRAGTCGALDHLRSIDSSRKLLRERGADAKYAAIGANNPIKGCEKRPPCIENGTGGRGRHSRPRAHPLRGLHFSRQRSWIPTISKTCDGKSRVTGARGS